MTTSLPTPSPSLIKKLESSLLSLKKAKSVQEKLLILNGLQQVEFPKNLVKIFFDNGEKELIIKSLAFIGQAEIIFAGFSEEIEKEKIEVLISQLKQLEQFYSPLGGIIGYHLAFLKLLNQKTCPPEHAKGRYEKPVGLDLSKNSFETRLAVRHGIELFGEMAEMYAVAGAGDRLNLQDEKSKAPLPAAQLKFTGRTLLEGLIRDLQGREYLHYKLMGKQLNTPIVMMTSLEKDNEGHIRQILKNQDWFNRSKDNFFIMAQPLVPVITESGLWALSAPLTLMLKPGGHGVIWKLALDSGAMNWLEQKGRTKTLVRQINNPIAGIDNGLLALSGIGCYQKKAFGFASCFRLLGAAEGIDVLIETPTANGYSYCLTNIEYTEFAACRIEDVPENPESKYSAFPSNTNILFADLSVIKPLMQEHPIPGMTINMKSSAVCWDGSSRCREYRVGRVESTMQNIADYIITYSPVKLKSKQKKNLQTFLTYNQREKTIATTKKLLAQDKPIMETPEGAFYELQLNAYNLFTQHCKMKLPPLRNEADYLAMGPSFVILTHPALGPLFSIVGQKIRHGEIFTGSELLLEIAELDIKNLSLKGSLHIEADQVMGHLENNQELTYGEASGKCTLHNVTVINHGIHYKEQSKYWKNEIERKEVLLIQLEGNAEFFAKNVTFKGPQQIKVPADHKLTAFMEGDSVRFSLKKIAAPSWYWAYSFKENNRIKLVKKKNKFTPFLSLCPP